MTTSIEPPRVLALAGTYNLRDVGGYPTEHGRRTRWRRLFRSDSLHRLAEPEQATLVGMGLRTVIDLRYERELTDSPNVFAASASVRYLNLPLVAGSSEGRREVEYPSLEELYRRIVDTRSAELVAIFSALAAHGALPALLHCTAGKDRTGVVVALLLRVLGVDADTIAADYSATEAHLAGEFMVNFRRETEARGIDWQMYEKLLGCPPEFMLRLLEYVDDAHGGIDEYLARAGLAREQIEALRAALVE
jgi:protein-tyrosine phosphatase